MKVALRKHPKHTQGVPWVACEPFVENSMAVLIHRVRYVTTHKIGDRWKAHLAVQAWCGNSSTGTKKFTFLAEPPEDRIVCARCEDIAIAHGHPPSKTFAGRHVHTGGVVAIARCCALNSLAGDSQPSEKNPVSVSEPTMGGNER